MKFLLKLFCLLGLLSSFAFSDYKEIAAFTDDYLKTLSKVNNVDEYGFIDNEKYFFVKSSKDNYNYVAFVSDIQPYYVLDRSFQAGVYNYDGNNFLTDGIYNAGLFYFIRQLFDTTYYYFGTGDTHNYSIFYKIGRANSISCKYSENVDLKSWQCVPACPAGQSWDIENGICYSDCTDKDLNKFGYSNGTAQGGCVDCSNALTDSEISSCVCSGFGSGLSEKGIYISNENSSFVSYTCANGSSITFKRRDDKKPDKDNNTTKPNDKNKDNNTTKPNEKDKNDVDKDKPNGENNNSGNNSGGSSGGNGSSGGGGTGVETKPNPNSGNGKEDGKGDGKQDGKGEEGKGDDNVGPANLDYEGLKASSETFEGQFKTAIDDSFSFVNDVKASLTDTLQKIKDGNLMSLKKGAVPTTCPLSFQIDMTYFSKNLTFDFCKIVSPVSSSLYILFYLGFFILFLFVTIKLFILTFMGW